MAYQPFASASELAVRLGVEFTSDQTAQANALLDDASNIIRSYVGQAINYVADDTVELLGVEEPYLNLPETPVISVSAVSVDGTALTTDEYSLVGNRLYRSSGWGDGVDDLVSVTYTHGHDEIPGLIVAITLQVAGRVYNNPTGVKSTSLGDYSVSYSAGADGPGIALTDAEMKVLDKFRPRKRKSTSVRLQREWDY